MTTRKRLLSIALAALLTMASCAALASDTITSDTVGMTLESINYQALFLPDGFVSNTLDAPFVSVAAIADVDWSAVPSSPIEHVKPVSPGDEVPEDYTVKGSLQAVWNGPQLFIRVTVENDITVMSTEAPLTFGSPSAADRDSVVFALDYYNDKSLGDEDDDGIFAVTRDGQLHWQANNNIPTLSSVHADPAHPEWTNRISSYTVDGGDSGYAVELALNLEGVELGNGTQFGFDVEIVDITAEPTTEAGPWGPVTSGHGVKQYWSHSEDSVYTNDFGNDHPRVLDWGTITLTDWDGATPFAYSDWRVTNALRRLNSESFLKGTWTDESQQALDAAIAQAEAWLNGGDAALAGETADNLEAAIADLRWKDTKYPDPFDLPTVVTLPNPYKFFQSDRVVETAEDWAERRAEILDLAQFYEYGYKPNAPDKLEIVGLKHYNIGDNQDIPNPWFPFFGPEFNSGPAAAENYVITIAMTVGETTSEITFYAYLPETPAPEGGYPAILSFDGDNAEYRQSGVAVVTVPTSFTTDNRTNEGAWQSRAGVFYQLFPYSRGGEGTLKEVSAEMAAAWGASRIIDTLELLQTDADEAEAPNIAADKLGVTGFSINGKYAFVSAVFDERIGVCIPGAAGATGPSPWRAVYVGHEYDWSGTAYHSADETVEPARQISTGTEVISNSIRHNRVRETELFRRFLTPWRTYLREPGAYGYANRLPYDQNDLVATLAPRAIMVVNTVNDYNDGSESDALGLEVSKSIYRALGLPADDLLVFNYRGVRNQDPHGSESAQHLRTAAFVKEYFLGEEMSEEDGAYIRQNPFTLPISDGETPYDKYYGGLDHFTDGWYSHEALK
ncbi:MAG: hypothetical protein LBD16_00070 [Oscillospiraceae bacterium]|jgi:hypothetical protein|nr:hypothetical protein [Oscillospiraceae bacterium]